MLGSVGIVYSSGGKRLARLSKPAAIDCFRVRITKQNKRSLQNVIPAGSASDRSDRIAVRNGPATDAIFDPRRNASADSASARRRWRPAE